MPPPARAKVADSAASFHLQAIRYVLIESSDYAQLPAEAEPEGSLGQSLMYLLRSSCASADFRRRVLTATLQCKKLPHNTGNVLALGAASVDVVISLLSCTRGLRHTISRAQHHPGRISHHRGRMSQGRSTTRCPPMRTQCVPCSSRIRAG